MIRLADLRAQLKSVVPSAGRRGALLADAATMGLCATCQHGGSVARAKGLAFFLCRFSEHGMCSQDTQPYRRFDLPGMRKRGTARGSAGIRLTLPSFCCKLSTWGDSAAGPSPISLRPRSFSIFSSWFSPLGNNPAAGAASLCTLPCMANLRPSSKRNYVAAAHRSEESGNHRACGPR